MSEKSIKYLINHNFENNLDVGTFNEQNYVKDYIIIDFFNKLFYVWFINQILNNQK